MSYILHNTAIEPYIINGHTIYVKREDLSTRPPLPPLAKLRGANVLLENLHSRGIRLVGGIDTRHSKSGQGIAAICAELGMGCTIGYPENGEGPPEQLRIAQQLGAELYPLRPNYIRILYYQMKRYVEQKGGYMLPFGIACVESVKAVAEEAKTVPEDLLIGSLVICVGTGTMLAGIILGVKRLPEIIGISSGISTHHQMKTIRRLLLEANISPLRLSELAKKLTLFPPIMPYARICNIETPFPSHGNYDKKVWWWLCNNIYSLKPPILFWNIGA